MEKISEKMKNNLFGYVKTEEYNRLYCKWRLAREYLRHTEM